MRRFIRRVRHFRLHILLAAVSSCAWAQQAYIPDHARTPGAINPDITQATLRRR
jgi:hypothetical protein